MEDASSVMTGRSYFFENTNIFGLSTHTFGSNTIQYNILNKKLYYISVL